MKKYTLKDYKRFCDEALIMPPFEDDDQIDEWFEAHKIHIIANDCVMELDYDADAVNEIDFTLREIYNAIEGDGEATTGNIFGSQYRASELKATLSNLSSQLLNVEWKLWSISRIVSGST